MIREHLDKAGISYQYLDGSTSMTQRKERVDAFQAGEGDVFLISLKAGGSGLNLTEADYVVHMDPWWNPAVEDQASDRAHRIGQTRPVTVYRLVAENTIEQKIIKLRKKYPDWGARKLKVLLEKNNLRKKIPPETTINAILKRNNLISRKRRRNPKEGKLYPKFDPSEANEI